MDAPIKAKPAADLRDYLAEERTFLAWIRCWLVPRTRTAWSNLTSTTRTTAPTWSITLSQLTCS